MHICDVQALCFSRPTHTFFYNNTAVRAKTLSECICVWWPPRAARASKCREATSSPLQGTVQKMSQPQLQCCPGGGRVWLKACGPEKGYGCVRPTGVPAFVTTQHDEHLMQIMQGGATHHLHPKLIRRGTPKPRNLSKGGRSPHDDCGAESCGWYCCKV